MGKGGKQRGGGAGGSGSYSLLLDAVESLLLLCFEVWQIFSISESYFFFI